MPLGNELIPSIGQAAKAFSESATPTGTPADAALVAIVVVVNVVCFLDDILSTLTGTKRDWMLLVG